MRAKEIRERTYEELTTMLVDTKEQLFRLRIKNATHQLDSTAKIGVARREIAKIKTILGERGTNASSELAGGEE